jgi:hypothetical protein
MYIINLLKFFKMQTITLENLKPGQTIFLLKRQFIVNSWRNDGKIYISEGNNEYTIYANELYNFTEKPSK